MNYVDQEQIYKETNQGKDIFAYYFPNYEFGGKDKIALRQEKTPSAHITFYKGLWRITDFGNQTEYNSLPAIPFVQKSENLIFKDAIQFIMDVIIRKEITSTGFFRPDYKALYSWREMEEKDQKGEYTFEFKDQPSKPDLESIGRYVDAELLERFNGKSVKSYELCSFSKKYGRDIVHKFESTETYPIFIFDYGTFKKMYKPMEPEKRYRFVYIGDKPKDYVYGLEQVKKAENEFYTESEEEEEPVTKPEGKPSAIVKDLFRCSGESDALNMASLGFHVYWLNSETANMDFDTWTMIDDLCESHFQIMDLDSTGQESALKFALKHISLYTVYLPQWLTYKKDWRGNPCKDIKDFINVAGSDLEDTFRKVTHLKKVAMPIKFWTKYYNEKTNKTEYNFNMEYYYHFLRANGFYTMDSNYHRRANYCYARVNGKIVDLIHPDDIKKLAKRFTKDWIKTKTLYDEIALLNKLNTSAQISETNLQELEAFEPVFKNCSAGTEFIHFKNGSIRITPDRIDWVKHEDVPNYILGNIKIGDTSLSHFHDFNMRLQESPIEVTATAEYQQLLDKLAAASNIKERANVNGEISRIDPLLRFDVKIKDPEYIFTQFLQDLSNLHWRKKQEFGKDLSDIEKKEQELVLVNILFVLGFNMAEYKDPGRPWLTFLQDMRISEVGQSSGRSGKSLLTEAIRKVRPMFYVGGKNKYITEKTDFIYDGFTQFHNNIEIDDLYEFADFNFFYTQVTGKREVNSKYISKQILDYADSGKMVISSNYELQNTDSSTLARVLNCGVSDYYHEATKYNDYKENRSPQSQFGRLIYDDFSEIEWLKFYSLAAYAIQLQMRFNKIQPPMGNLEQRQLRREMTRGLGTGEEFLNWANTYFCVAPENHVDLYSPEHSGYFNTYIKKEVAYEVFKQKLTPKQANSYKITQFKKALQAYCSYYGFELNPESLCGNDQNIKLRRIIKTVDGKSIEYLYISTDKEAVSFDEPSDEVPF